MAKFNYDKIGVMSVLSKEEIEKKLYRETKRIGGESERMHSGEMSYSGNGNFLDVIKHPGLSRYTCWQVEVSITDLGDRRKVELSAIGESALTYLTSNFLSVITLYFIKTAHRYLSLGISKGKRDKLSQLI